MSATIDIQVLIAALAASIVGIIATWHFERRRQKSIERQGDLLETRRALIAHYNAMDRIIASDSVPDKLKRSMMAVTAGLANRELASKICEIVTGKKHSSSRDDAFADAVERLRVVSPEIIGDVETAMSSALFICMLRWPETSEQFKRFVVSSMMNERKEAATFSKVSEIAKKNTSVPSHLQGVFDNGVLVVS